MITRASVAAEDLEIEREVEAEEGPEVRLFKDGGPVPGEDN